MKAILVFLLFLLMSFGAAVISAQFPPGQWYAELSKPTWNPPNWIFAPVWTVLYALIGVSGWLVWRRTGVAASALALSVFALQLFLNAAWSWIFFGLHRPGAAFVEIVLLWFAILATIILFWRVFWVAAMLLLPYLAWVGFAGLLNWALWRLNIPHG